jgi:hypothetical protein
MDDNNMENNNIENNGGVTENIEQNNVSVSNEENGVNWDGQGQEQSLENAYPDDPFADTATAKKSKKKPVLIGAAAVVAAAVVGVSGAAAVKHENPIDMVKGAVVSTMEKVTGKTFGTPEERLTKAVENTKQILGERGFVSSGVSDMLENGQATVNGSVSIKSLPEQTQLEGAGISFTLNSDKTTGEGDFALNATYHGLNLDALSIYTDGTEVLAGVPMVTNKYVISFDADNIDGQIKNSPVLQNYYGADTLAEMASTYEANSEMQSAFEGLISDNYSVLCDSVTYEDAEEVQGHGSAIKVSIPSEAVDTFLEDTLRGIVDSEAMADYIAEIAEANGDDADEAKSEANEGIDEFLESVEIKDASAVFYIDNNVITDSDIVADFAINEQNGTISLKGGLNEDELALELKISADDNYVTINYSDTDSDSSRVITTSVKSSDTDSDVLSYSSNYDKSSNALSGKLAITDYGTFEFNGTLESTKDTFNLDLSSVKLVADFQGESQLLCEFGVNLGIAPMSESIVKPEGEKVRIFEVSEDELTTVASDLQEDLTKFYNNIISQLS